MTSSDAPGRRSDVVHDRLRRDVLEGRIAPGEAVASERALAEELGVNRHAVREALKRLEQAGLITISQGGATRVRDWRHTGGLEVLLDLLGGTAGDVPPLELARAVLEMRESIGVDAARRCAARGDGSERADVARRAEACARGIGGGDDAALDLAYAELWVALVDGARNLAYRLALNSLVAALDRYPGVAGAVRPTDAEGLRALGAAVRDGDEDAAGAAARRLLEPDTRALG